jgi:hypothetical protein
LAFSSLPHIAERALLLTIAAPELMPPPATLPSSAAFDKRLSAGSKVEVATLAVSGGYHDWQVPIAAALSQHQAMFTLPLLSLCRKLMSRALRPCSTFSLSCSVI